MLKVSLCIMSMLNPCVIQDKGRQLNIRNQPKRHMAFENSCFMVRIVKSPLPNQLYLRVD